MQRAGARFDERRLLWMNGAFYTGPLFGRAIRTMQRLLATRGRGLLGRLPPRRAGAGAGAPKVSGGIAGLTSFFFTDLPINPG